MRITEERRAVARIYIQFQPIFFFFFCCNFWVFQDIGKLWPMEKIMCGHQRPMSNSWWAFDIIFVSATYGVGVHADGDHLVADKNTVNRMTHAHQRPTVELSIRHRPDFFFWTNVAHAIAVIVHTRVL